MSAHVANVFRLEMEAHPNADNLAVVHVPNTAFTVCVRQSDWAPGSLVALVEPDTLVADTEANAWLCDCKLEEGHFTCRRHARIRARKFRGVWSQGLLVPAPEGSAEGDNVWDALGLTRYEPPVDDGPHGLGSSDARQGPPGVDVVYDVENWYRYPKVFLDGERLVATEKIHGANARFTFREGEMFVGSRRRWLKEADNAWFKVLRLLPQIEEFCRSQPGATLYGEIFGTQDLKYGLSNGAVGFVAFDIMLDNGRYVPYHTFLSVAEAFGIPTAPQAWVGEYYGAGTDVWLQSISGGQSLLWPSGIREGVVVRPYWSERWDPTVGRVQLKLVSNSYLERAK